MSKKEAIVIKKNLILTKLAGLKRDLEDLKIEGNNNKIKLYEKIIESYEARLVKLGEREKEANFHVNGALKEKNW